MFKLEETGYGDILTPEFVQWRQELDSNTNNDGNNNKSTTLE